MTVWNIRVENTFGVERKNNCLIFWLSLFHNRSKFLIHYLIIDFYHIQVISKHGQTIIISSFYFRTNFETMWTRSQNLVKNVLKNNFEFQVSKCTFYVWTFSNRWHNCSMFLGFFVLKVVWIAVNRKNNFFMYFLPIVFPKRLLNCLKKFLI